VLIRQIPVEQTRPLRHEVLRPHESIEYLIAHELADAFAVGAFDDDDGGRLVAVGFVGPDGDPGGWRVRGMATAPEARGRGAGSAVLAALLEHARGRGATRVWCNARLRARTLYERAGFMAVSEEFDLPQIGPHYMMELRPEGGGAQATSITSA